MREILQPGPVPLWVHPNWSERFPWLVQGTTGAGDPAEPFDLGLFGSQPVGAVLERWRALRGATEMPGVVHARQVHAAGVAVHGAAIRGTLVSEGTDGHVTNAPGLLLAVSVADCVPVSLVDPDRRAIALLHAGWRGTAAGILSVGLAKLHTLVGTEPGDLWVHLGPAICGSCYEVGPEVHAAIHPERPPPAAPEPIDVRAALAAQAETLGVRPDRISASEHCTRCGPGDFFSHRGGSTARQMGVLGVRTQ